MFRNTLLIFLCCCSIQLFAPPQATAQEASNLIHLDGSGSQDADGDRLVYSWRQISGPKVELLAAQTAKPSFYAEAAGDYTFELIVSDGKTKSKPAIVNVLIEEANEIPRAVLPSKLAVELGSEIILDGSNSSDADHDTLLYNFNQISGPAQLMRSTVSQEPRFTVTPKTVGTYSFELIVNDGRANSAPALCVVEVTKPNSAPVARVSAPKKAVINTRHHFNATVKNNAPEATVATPARVTISKIDTPSDLIHTDSNLLESNANAELQSVLSNNKIVSEVGEDSIIDISSIQQLNITPIASTSDDICVTPGTKVVIKGFGVDPDGDSLQFIWNQSSGPIIPGSPIMRKNLAFIPRKEGTYVFKLTVNDGKATSDPAYCSVTVRTADSTARAEINNGVTISAELNNTELAIPRKEDTVQAQLDEDNISFRELFSIE